MSRFIFPRQGVKGQNLTLTDGAKLYFYEVGTVTPKDTYTDEAKSIPSSNPVIADAKGLFSYIEIDGSYDVKLTDKNDVTYWGPETIRELSGILDLTNKKNTYETFAAAIADPGLTIGEYSEVGERDYSTWKAVDATTVIENGKDIVSGSAAISFQAIQDENDGYAAATLGEFGNDEAYNKRKRYKAVVSFIFDDGYSSITTDVVPLFKTKGMTCGFAIPPLLVDSASTTYDSITNLLDHQINGFEICNHGLDENSLVVTTKGTPYAESQINDSYNRLREYGFDVQTYIAGNSVLNSAYIPIVKRNHASAYTVDGSAFTGAAALQPDTLDAYALYRPSLFSLGLAAAKAVVDAAIAGQGWVTFYDHDPTQVFFPSSMSLVNLEALLDYCVAQNVLVLNPRDALNAVHNSVDHGRKSEISSIKAQGVVNANLLRDPLFKTLNEIYSGWGDGAGNGDGTFTIGARRNGVFGNECALTVGADGTIVDGSYLLTSAAQRREADFFPTSGNLTFSIQPYVTVTTFDDNFDLTIGLQQKRTSDNVVLATIESSVLTTDTRGRKYSITLSPDEYSVATYFETFVRVKEKITAVGGTVIIANPKLEQGSQPTRYTSTAPVDINDWDFADDFIVIPTTGIIAGTKLLLTAQNNNFWQITGDNFLSRDTGFYTFELVVTGIVAGPYTNIETYVEAYVNGIAEGRIEPHNNNGTRLYYRWRGTKYLKSGETMAWYLTQSASGGALNTDNGSRSFLRVCKIS